VEPRGAPRPRWGRCRGGHDGAAPARAAAPLRASVPVLQLGRVAPRRLLVIGGNGFVGREVCKYAVQNGFQVTSLSRRGECPLPEDEWLSQVKWMAGDALDKATVQRFVAGADAVVHTIGLLFDVDSGLVGLNAFTSASKSKPSDASTYDNITRKTALMVIDALNARATLPELLGGAPIPMVFMSAAEAGWPEVSLGEQVEAVSPDWLKRYLVAKRAVEAELARSTGKIRSVVIRPSLIWNWAKLDVLPVIPVFNLANAVGIPFVDKTVRVEDVGRSIVAALLDENVQGVQRYDKIEALSASLPRAE